jgi:uncharacterized membrane protein YebE (DUF533 family)
MFNMQDLLGKMLEANMPQSGGGRIRNAMSGQNPPADASADAPGGGADGGLGGLLDKVRGADWGGALGNLAGTAKDMATRTKDSVTSGDPLAIGGLAALAGAILGGGGKALRGAVGAGALAVLAKVAYDAMQNQKKAGPEAPSQGELPLGLRPPKSDAETKALKTRAELMLRAMIAAAKADGQIDAKETAKIMGKLEELGAGQEAIDYVNQHMNGPADMESLARAVPDKETGLQVYAASLLAIEADTPAEKDYLRALAARLGLDPAAVANVHAILGVKA